MGKKNYYVILGGLAPGIYSSWEECKSILSIKGGSCKGFSELVDAKRYLTGEEEIITEPTAYVDGSYEEATNIYGFGCVILLPNKEKWEFLGSGDDKNNATLRNITGEMLGAMFATKWALAHELTTIKICYDYKGIEMWASGVWNANTVLTQKYASAMKRWGEKIQIHFQKISAHSGNSYNERADVLAKKAVREAIPMPDFRK